MMEDDEKNLSPEGKAVLAIVRRDTEEGRLTPEQAAFLNKAIALKESVGVLTDFVIKLAVFAGSIAALITYWPRRDG